LAVDNRTYEQKLVSALDHPLPEARVRACWLVGFKQIKSGTTKLMSLVTEDPDLFVRHAAVQALGKLHSWTAVPLLESLVGQDDHRMAIEARKSLNLIKDVSHRRK
jgi:HEAT repeat protein